MDDNQDAATKRKPARPARYPQEPNQTRERQNRRLLAVFNPPLSRKKRLIILTCLSLNPKATESSILQQHRKDKIIEAMDRETIVPLSKEQSIAVNDLLRELDCFELKRKN